MLPMADNDLHFECAHFITPPLTVCAAAITLLANEIAHSQDFLPFTYVE